MTLTPSSITAIRFGYGLGSASTADDAETLIAELEPARRQVPLFPLGGAQQRLADIRNYLQEQKRLNQMKAAGGSDAEPKKALRSQAQALFRKDAMARIAQAVTSPYAFHERLASFWINHFTVGAGKTPVMLLMVPHFEAVAIRPHLSGSFRELVAAASLHPAMLTFLDQAKSVGPNSPVGKRRGSEGPNENFARELMELHTLGVDAGYSQEDVQQLALLLTGLAIDPMTGETRFEQRRAEPGQFTVLGKVYQRSDVPFADARLVFDDLSRDPRTIKHISTQLASHFISEPPPAAVVEAMARRWEDTDGDLTAIYRAMLGEPMSWEAAGSKIKMPLDYVVSSLKALDADEAVLLKASTVGPVPRQHVMADGDAAMDGMMQPKAQGEPRPKGGAKRQPLAGHALRALTDLGQPLWRASNAAGFDDESQSWLSPSQISERIAWARRAIGYLGAGRDPREFVETTLADFARDDTIRVVGQAPNRQAGLLAALASPEFNRR